MVLSEGIMSLKNPVPPPGIGPATVRLVVQRLNHYATPRPFYCGCIKVNWACQDRCVCVCVCVCVRARVCMCVCKYLSVYSCISLCTDEFRHKCHRMKGQQTIYSTLIYCHSNVVEIV
jgi:hypothetical protein